MFKKYAHVSTISMVKIQKHMSLSHNPMTIAHQKNNIAINNWWTAYDVKNVYHEYSNNFECSNTNYWNHWWNHKFYQKLKKCKECQCKARSPVANKKDDTRRFTGILAGMLS